MTAAALPTRSSRLSGVGGVLLCIAFTAALLANHSVARVVLVLVPLAAVALLSMQPAAVVLSRRLPVPIVLFVLWCIASTAWTRSSVGTQDALLDLVAAVATGWCLGSLATYDELLRWCSRGVRAIVAVTIAVLRVAPGWSTQPAIDGAPGWHSVFTHKNGLGAFTVIALVTLWHDRRAPHRHLWMAGCLVLMVGSRSSTSLALLLVLIAVLMWKRSLGNLSTAPARAGYLTASVGLVVGAVLVFISRFDVLTSVLGRGSDLSGRTGIWNSVWRAGVDRPVLGYGFGGTWVEPVAPTSTIWKELRFEAFHAHSGYLDLLLQVGFVGLLLFLTAVVVTALRALRHGGPGGSWAATVLLLLSLNALAESGPFLGIGLLVVSLLASTATNHRCTDGRPAVPVRLPVRTA